MIIVITKPDFFTNEAEAIVRLFEQREVDYLHLRKPEATEAEVEQLIRQIPQALYPRITMHDFYDLAIKYKLGGIHLTGRHPDVPECWTGRVSTSCHSLQELKQRRQEGYAVGERRQAYSYLSLSPVFDSISKQGYKAAFTLEELQTSAQQGLIDAQVLALGGVTFDRIDEVLSMGFGGGMILGDAWK